MDLEQAMREIGEQESALQQFDLPSRQIRCEPGIIRAGDMQMRLAQDGIRHLCVRLQAPFCYIRKLDESMGMALLQHQIDRGDLEKNLGSALVTVIAADGEFFGLAEAHLVRLPGVEILSAVIQGIGEETTLVDVHDLQVSPKGFQLEVLSRNLAEEVLPGDVVRAGVRLTHSFMGESATLIETYILRLVCSNGLLHRSCVSRRVPRTRRLPSYLPGARERQREQVKRLAAEVWSALGSKLHALRVLTTERVEVPQLLSRWLERGRLSSGALMPFLLQAWREGGAMSTMWAALNSLTAVGTHNPELSHRQRQVLLRLAGLLAFRHVHLCPRCFSLLSEPWSAGGGARSKEEDSLPDGGIDGKEASLSTVAEH